MNADLMSQKRAALLLKQQHGSTTPVYLQLPYTSNSPAIFETLASLFDGRHSNESAQTSGTSSEVTYHNDPAAARVSRYQCFP